MPYALAWLLSWIDPGVALVLDRWGSHGTVRTGKIRAAVAKGKEGTEGTDETGATVDGSRSRSTRSSVVGTGLGMTFRDVGRTLVDTGYSQIKSGAVASTASQAAAVEVRNQVAGMREAMLKLRRENRRLVRELGEKTAAMYEDMRGKIRDLRAEGGGGGGGGGEKAVRDEL